MISHQTLRRLVYFAAIADAGSIRGAAERLNLSVPVVSEALSDLEAELGVSLAIRTTRHFALTEAGVETQGKAQEILDTAQSLTDLTSLDKPLTGRLSLTVPVELAAFWLPSIISVFQAKHPDVTFDIDVTDGLVDLRASRIELAIRTDYVAPGAKTRSALNLPLVLVASEHVEIDAGGTIPLPLIDSRSDRALLATRKTDGSVTALNFTQIHKITNRSAGLQMAQAGIGAIMVMRGSVEAELKQGGLIELLPELDFGSVDLNCLFRDRLPSQCAQVFAAESGL